MYQISNLESLCLLRHLHVTWWFPLSCRFFFCIQDYSRLLLFLYFIMRFLPAIISYLYSQSFCKLRVKCYKLMQKQLNPLNSSYLLWLDSKQWKQLLKLNPASTVTISVLMGKISANFAQTCLLKWYFHSREVKSWGSFYLH